MRINKKLNLVFPLDTDNGEIFVHSMPISREVFEKYFLVISKTFTKLFREGLEIVAGPRVCNLLLKQVANEIMVAPGVSAWDAADGVENGLMAEIRRLTNVIMIADKDRGWETIPYQDAVTKQYISSDDVYEVEGLITFFIVASAMLPRNDLPGILNGIERLWSAHSTSSNCTEYLNSLLTSRQAEATATEQQETPTQGITVLLPRF